TSHSHSRLYCHHRSQPRRPSPPAMASVREHSHRALTQAHHSGSGPGWVDRPRTVTTHDESGAQSTYTLYVTDEGGGASQQAMLDHVFDPDAFTAWYARQGGLQNKAFADLYGASHTQFVTDESGASVAGTISFDHPNWTMYGVGEAMVHRELVHLDPDHAPELNNNDAVGFDPEVGWATSRSNIHQDSDWLDSLAQIAFVGVVSWMAFPLAAEAGAAVGG